MELVFELMDLYFAQAPKVAQIRVYFALDDLRRHDAQFGANRTILLNGGTVALRIELENILRLSVQSVILAGENWHNWRRAWYRICP